MEEIREDEEEIQADLRPHRPQEEVEEEVDLEDRPSHHLDLQLDRQDLLDPQLDRQDHLEEEEAQEVITHSHSTLRHL